METVEGIHSDSAIEALDRLSLEGLKVITAPLVIFEEPALGMFS